ncbi:hypothetical protein FRC05_001721 [Tulasnella sp. 425]|nr:hypothetical protein FRC05_001721 [Tulasnella sp. 425]
MSYLSAQPDCFSEDDTWFVESLDSQHRTYPPPRDDDATRCQCSEPTYALIQACTVCQGYPSTTLWSDWTEDCGGKTYTRFPFNVSSLIKIPDWANLDVTQADKWNEDIARTYAGPDPPTETLAPASSSSGGTNHSRTIKIIIGCSVGVGCLLILAAAFIISSCRNRPRTRPGDRVEDPTNDGLAIGQTVGSRGNAQVGAVPPAVPMGRTTGQPAMAWGAAPDPDQAQDALPGGEENPIDDGTATRPTLGPGENAQRRRHRSPPTSGRMTTGEQRHFQGTQPPGGQRQVVEWDEDNDRPIYKFSRTTYRTDTQAMENWRDGAAGGQSSRAGQLMNAQPGNGPPGRSLWPQASSYGPGADPVTRPSPLQTTGAENPDAPGATPSPAPAVASSSGTQQPRAPKGPKNPKPVPPKGPARKVTVDTDSEED